jgi:hypothetical protein
MILTHHPSVKYCRMMRADPATAGVAMEVPDMGNTEQSDPEAADH